MKKNSILSLKPEEFSKKLSDLKEEYFNLRFRHGVGQLEKNSTLRKVRRDIARLKTVMRAQELSTK